METENSEKNTKEDESNLFNSFEKSKSITNFYPSLNKTNNKTISEQKETKYTLNLEKMALNNEKINDLSIVDENIDNSIDEETMSEYYLINNHKELTFEKKLILINYLIDFFEYSKNANLTKKNIIIRCFLEEEHNKPQQEKCFRIPIIIKTALGMKFSCDGKNFKFLSAQEIIQKILNKELFIDKTPSINSGKGNEIKENNNKENAIDIKSAKFTDINGIKKIQRNAQRHFNFSLKMIKKDIKAFKKYMILYNKYQHQKNEIERKIKNIFFSLFKHINNFLYWIIIKKTIKESFGLNQKNKNLKNIKLNLNFAASLIKYINDTKNKKDKLFSKPNIEKLKIYTTIHFYFEEEIKFILDKYIFIGINVRGNIYILLFNIDFKILPNEKTQYKIIKEQNLKQLKSQKRIFKLKKECLSKNDKEKNNYFVISSYKENKAVIINAIEYLDNPIEQRYQIEIINVINFEKGLYSSIQIEYNKEYYILNYNKNFTLWFYDKKINKAEYKEISVNKLKDKETLNDNYRYGPLIQGQNKNLIIVQILYPFYRFEIYEIGKDLCMNLKGYIELEKNNINISKNNNNYFLYKDKYLLIASCKIDMDILNESTGKIKQKIIKAGKGEICIFDIEKNIFIKSIIFDDVKVINSFIRINDNNIICSATININCYKKNYFNGKLILLNIEENKNEINLIRKEKNEYIGNCEYIISEKLIDDSYLLCFSENNNICKLNEKNEFVHYFSL